MDKPGPSVSKRVKIFSDEAFLFLCTFAFTRNAKFFKFSNSKCISCGNSGIDKYKRYSHHSIKRTGSIKRPGLKFFKKSLLNVPYDPKFW